MAINWRIVKVIKFSKSKEEVKVAIRNTLTAEGTIDWLKNCTAGSETKEWLLYLNEGLFYSGFVFLLLCTVINIIRYAFNNWQHLPF